MPRKKEEPPKASTFNPDTAMDHLDFDSLEEKIRGEEIMNDAGTRNAREAQDIKKKLSQSELDRRFAELKKKVKGD